MSSPRGKLAGPGLAGMVLLLLMCALYPTRLLFARPVTGPSPSSTAVVRVGYGAEPGAVEPTEVPPVATSALGTTPPTAAPFATPTAIPPTATPMPTPEWTFLPSSAPIRPGIYVRVVKPAGFDVFKGAGFDQDFITTAPAGRLLYVLPGTTRANSLTWIRVTDGAVVGWGVQDQVTAYGIRNGP
jgi:hypothetical protein